MGILKSSQLQTQGSSNIAIIEFHSVYMFIRYVCLLGRMLIFSHVLDCGRWNVCPPFGMLACC